MRPKGLWFPKLLSAAPLIGLLLGAIGAIDGQLATSAEQVPIVDGGAGPCSVEFTVTDGQGNPIYAATISVHIAYGFAGLHKLDLEAGTNSVGKARFTGLPKKVKGGSMFFRQLSATPNQFKTFVEAVSLMQRTQPNYSVHDLAQIDVPVAIVQSEHDEFIRRDHAEYLARSIPNAELVILNGVSHFAPLQRPDQFNSVMLSFLVDRCGMPGH